MIALSDVDILFSDFVFSNTSATHIYHVFNSNIAINDFLLNDVMISDSFLSSSDSNIVINSFTYVNGNCQNSSGLFDLRNGYLNITNFNISEFMGSLFALNGVEYSVLQHVSLHELQSDTVFLFVNISISISDVSILYSNVDVVFESYNSLIFLDELNSIGLNSSTIVNASSSVLILNHVNFSQLLTVRALRLLDVTLELNYFSISHSILTSGFIMTCSTNSTLLSVDITNINENFNSSSDSSDNYLFVIRGGFFSSQNSHFSHVYSNFLMLESSVASFHRAEISNIIGSPLFNIVDSHLNLSSITLTQTNADVLLTCLHCTGSMDHLLIENSSFTSLFHLDYGYMSFNTTSLTKINTSLVFETFNCNVTINHLDIGFMRIYKSFIYSEFSIIVMSSINAAYIRDASDPLFMFNHSELTVVDIFCLQLSVQYSLYGFISSNFRSFFEKFQYVICHI
ncbi:hypothetical protein GEMRC1_009092 [Eukaryota sp. GEM-RC1]